MSAETNTLTRTLEDAVAKICRKTGLTPDEVLNAFDGLVMMGYADRLKVKRIKDKLKYIDPEKFH